VRAASRSGVADLVERCCRLASHMAARLVADEHVELLNDVVLNQVLVRFRSDAGANITNEVMAAAQSEGTSWMSGTTWNGEAAMRISVCNWRTTDEDIHRSADALLAVAGYGLLAKK
jgi:glutamate/tyrosine decarboxylase-like PLP-dependent enzyme